MALLRRGGVTISAVVSIHSDKAQLIDPYAGDILLQREDLLGFGPFARAAHSRHSIAAH